MFSRAIAFAICIICLILPWRLRVIFGEILGWIIQSIYFSYYGIINYLLTELRKNNNQDKSDQK